MSDDQHKHLNVRMIVPAAPGYRAYYGDTGERGVTWFTDVVAYGRVDRGRNHWSERYVWVAMSIEPESGALVHCEETYHEQFIGVYPAEATEFDLNEIREGAESIFDAEVREKQRRAGKRPENSRAPSPSAP